MKTKHKKITFWRTLFNNLFRREKSSSLSHYMQVLENTENNYIGRLTYNGQLDTIEYKRFKFNS